MLPEAQVVHQILGRVRLRILGKRNDVAYFSRLEDTMRACPVIKSATTNPLTSSVIMQHEGSIEAMLAFAEARQLFKLVENPPLKLKDQVAQGLSQSSRNLETVSGGKVDLDGVLFLGLTGLAIHQAIEGNIMAPAVTLMWYALSAARGTKQ